MSIFCIGTAPGRVIPVSEYNIIMEEDRFFLPGIIHGGEYLIQAYAYSGETCDKIEVSYLTPYDIISAQNEATAADDTFNPDKFTDILNETAENFICENTPDDPCFAELNSQWANSKTMTPDEIIEWAKQYV